MVGGVMRLLLAAAMAILASPAAAAEARPRVASINVCTDQLVLALADPAQIAGLGPFSRDPRQSLAAAEASRYRRLSGQAEDVLALKPDIVVASRFDKRETRALMKDHGLRVVEFALPQTIAQARDEIAAMGALLGHPDRTAAQIAAIDAAVGRAAAIEQRGLRALALSRRGWVAGADSLLSSMLAAAGLRNAAAEAGVASGGFMSIEAVIRLRPDVLVVSEAGDFAEDEGRAFLIHPALEKLYPSSQRLVVPTLLSDCGGVAIAPALDGLVDQLRRRGS